MGWKDAVADLARLAQEHAGRLRERATDAIGQHLRFDDARREAALSDDLVARVLEGVAGGDGTLTVAPRDTGYDVRLRGASGAIAVHLVPAAIRLRDGGATIELLTPEPVTLDGRPVATWLVRLVARLLGGTRLARRLLSSRLPPSVQWDGVRAVHAVTADAARSVAMLRSAPAVDGTLAREPGWLRIAVADAGQYGALKRHLGASLLLGALDLAASAVGAARDDR